MIQRDVCSSSVYVCVTLPEGRKNCDETEVLRREGPWILFKYSFVASKGIVFGFLQQGNSMIKMRCALPNCSLSFRALTELYNERGDQAFSSIEMDSDRDR